MREIYACRLSQLLALAVVCATGSTSAQSPVYNGSIESEPQSQLERCLTGRSADTPAPEHDAIDCVLLAVQTDDEQDLASRLREMVALAPHVAAIGFSCAVTLQVYRDVVPANVGCEKFTAAYHLFRYTFNPADVPQSQLEQRPGFFPTVRLQSNTLSRPKSGGVSLVIPPGDIFDVTSANFRRPGFAGKVNYSVTTGRIVDLEIVFWKN